MTIEIAHGSFQLLVVLHQVTKKHSLIIAAVHTFEGDHGDNDDNDDDDFDKNNDDDDDDDDGDGDTNDNCDKTSHCMEAKNRRGGGEEGTGP